MSEKVLFEKLTGEWEGTCRTWFEPNKLADEKPPSYAEIENNTRLTYADVDAGPTKAWMIAHRDDPEVEKLWDLGFGPRPEEELYDLKKDPHQVVNVAGDANYYETRKKLNAQLMAELKANDDPRLKGDTFDKEPYNKRTKPGQTKR